MPKDYKEWINDRAYELADEKHNTDFHFLTEQEQAEIWKQAEEDYADYLGSQINHARDIMKERGLYDQD